jgi:hypothetical protein
MKRVLCLIQIFLFASAIYSQVVINEVMYAPTSPNKEWFEIYNTGSTAINLQNWKWRDAAQSNPIRTITTQSIILNPNEYAIVCEDSVNLRTAYPGITGIILQSIGWNALNNTGNENVVLYNSSGQTIDSLTYNNSWGGSSGNYSLERINPLGPTNQQSNWGTSIDPQKASPNRKNSLTPKQYDLKLISFVIKPQNPVVGDSLKLEFLIKNIGLNPASNFTLKIYYDLNLDSIPIESELINSQTFVNQLNQNDSVNYLFGIGNIDSGIKQYIGKLVWQPDEDTLNNILINRVNVGGTVVTSGILINEIMYAPQSPEPEWVELINTSYNPINIKNWKIADSSSYNSPITITNVDRFIAPNDFLVIAKNNSIIGVHHLIDTTKILYLSNLPALNNDRDKVAIFNNSGSVVDEVSYKSSWGGSSRNSLERKSVTRPSNDSTNWATSLDCEYSSPTRTNSVVNIASYSRNDVVINEIMFDPLTISCEWLELYNPSNKYINLTGWRCFVSNSIYNLSDSCNFFLAPNKYLILAADTTLYNRFSYLKPPDTNFVKIVFRNNLSLNNNGTLIRIVDALNNTIDSVNYSPKWHNINLSDTKGFSLERINPLLGSNDRSNWNSCADILGGTPGKRNSIYTNNNISTDFVSVFPNPFSPDGDGFEDFTIIKFKLKANIAQLRVKVYDVKGRLVRTLLNNQLSGSEGQIIFDGMDDSGQKLRIGIYILYIEALDNIGGRVVETKTTVVIASKL